MPTPRRAPLAASLVAALVVAVGLSVAFDQLREGPSTVAVGASSAPTPLPWDGTRLRAGEVALVGWHAGSIEQVDGRVRNCYLWLESDPPQCGGGPTITGVDLTQIPEAEQDPFGNAPDQWLLDDAYLELAVSEAGALRYVDHELGHEVTPPDPIRCPADPEPISVEDGYLQMEQLVDFDGPNQNILSFGWGEDLDIEVIYATPAVVDELCGLTAAPTLITPVGIVLEP